MRKYKAQLLCLFSQRVNIINNSVDFEVDFDDGKIRGANTEHNIEKKDTIKPECLNYKCIE